MTGQITRERAVALGWAEKDAQRTYTTGLRSFSSRVLGVIVDRVATTAR